MTDPRALAEQLEHWAKPDKFGNREGRADEFACAAETIRSLHAENERLQRIVALVMAYDSNLIDHLERSAYERKAKEK